MNIPKILKRTREVIKTDGGKNIQISSFNRLTKKGVSKEKDITYKTKDEPRAKYIEKQVVKRDKEGDWTSQKESKKLFKGGKKVRSDVQYETYKKGGAIKSGKTKIITGGEEHVIYKKTNKIGKGKSGDIMVNHPSSNNGKWDTINLTKKSGAKTVKQGVVASKKWHKNNPHSKIKKKK
jgi:hypothetical protein